MGGVGIGVFGAVLVVTDGSGCHILADRRQSRYLASRDLEFSGGLCGLWRGEGVAYGWKIQLDLRTL